MSCGTNPSTQASHTRYNSNGTVAATWTGNAGSSPSDAIKTLYTYYPTDSTDSAYVDGSAGLVKTIRLPQGNCASTVTAGRSLCTTYTYDAAGRIDKVTDGNANVVEYTDYDEFDRAQQVLLDGYGTCYTSTAHCVAYAFDVDGNQSDRYTNNVHSSYTYDLVNRLTEADVPGSSDEKMTYDDASNMKTFQQIASGLNDTVTYSYDPANQLSTVADGSGTINVSEDNDGRPSEYHFPGATRVEADYSYQPSGKPKNLTVATDGGTTLGKWDYSYTASVAGTAFRYETDQLQSTQASNGTADDGTSTYGYDHGNLTSVADTGTGPALAYTYDAAGNLSKETIGSTSTYNGYNQAGQLCWTGPTDAASPAARLSNTCASATVPTGDTAHTFDAAGNDQTTLAGGTASYDSDNRVSAIDGVSSTYLDQGNQLRDTAGTTKFVNSSMGISAVKVGSTWKIYTRTPDGTILDERDGSNITNFVTSPIDGSVLELTSPAGAKIGTYRYQPYGATTVGTDVSSAATNNPFRYISGYQNSTSSSTAGTYKLGARYYDTQGHFTQQDPAGQGSGGYLYGAGDPINYSDASGMAPWNNADDFFSTLNAYDGVDTLKDIAGTVDAFRSGDYREAFADITGLGTGATFASAVAPAAAAAFVPSLGTSAIAAYGASNYAEYQGKKAGYQIYDSYCQHRTCGG